MGEQGGLEGLMGEDAARAFMAEAEAYLADNLGHGVRSYDASLAVGMETATYILQFRLDFDGGTETRVPAGHMMALHALAGRHGATARPMRLEPEHPAEGEPYTMILTYHFNEGS